jgi:hypothetical protein
VPVPYVKPWLELTENDRSSRYSSRHRPSIPPFYGQIHNIYGEKMKVIPPFCVFLDVYAFFLPIIRLHFPNF